MHGTPTIRSYGFPRELRLIAFADPTVFPDIKSIQISPNDFWTITGKAAFEALSIS
jgi:hypothetical protein